MFFYSIIHVYIIIKIILIYIIIYIMELLCIDKINHDIIINLY